MIVFDLDGVLLDSRDAIINAYENAGTPAPDDILEQEGTGWLEKCVGKALAKTIHDKKNEEYVKLLSNGLIPILPPLQTAIRLQQFGYVVGLMTGAPVGSTDAFKLRCLCQHRVWPFDVAVEAVTTQQKMQQLSDLDSHGVYIDDQDRLVNVPDGWRFIKYSDQPPGMLYEEIVSCVCV